MAWFRSDRLNHSFRISPSHKDIVLDNSFFSSFVTKIMKLYCRMSKVGSSVRPKTQTRICNVSRIQIETLMIYGAGFFSVITSDNHTLLYSSVPFMKKHKSVFSRPYMSCNATLEVSECCRTYDGPCAYDADHTTFDIAWIQGLREL